MREAVVSAARFISTRAAEPIGLGDVADHVGYSPFHLARVFEQELGLPPGQYLTARRFEKAKQLLLRGDERIIDVCNAVGFSAPGTFTTRFTAAVGATPVEFRRLPEVLTGSPPRPVVLPGGDRTGGTVMGTVRLSPAAAVALGPDPAVYVGLFPKRVARGFPVSGTLLAQPGDFLLGGVPPGTYWVLSSALPSRAGAAAQLLPGRSVVGASSRAVHVSAQAPVHQRDVHLDLGADWSTPVLIALPALASAGAQDRRRRR
ncbi:helix-turn-helix transcriptional regulator [Amycolatopsis granulosa]|uniref:helix-turn-helix transcriptional regulator n=1 Tax=Amycolatopsis granulosa TaxID=185684 RepID=UPI0014242BDD|nr:helix-turn-helix transcriptional regulator [Amycolatopsis granulosa]NIH85418.1 AraC-like DNA-binding protein [Amycolatopsis granulosa]